MLNYKRHAFLVVVIAAVAIVAILIGLMANRRQSKPLKNDTVVSDSPQPVVANAEPITFTYAEADVNKLGIVAMKTYFAFLMSGKTAIDERIASYKIKDIYILAGDSNEFCVSFNYDFTTDNDSYFNPARAAKGKGTWPDNYLELRVKHAYEKVYAIKSVGTGGGAQGLEPFKEEYKYTGAIDETYSDRHFELQDIPENAAEALVVNNYYYDISGKFDKLNDIYGESGGLKISAVNTKKNFEKGAYIKEYVVHSLSTLSKESVESASTFYFKKALADIEEFKLTDIGVIKAEISMAWSEKGLSDGPQLKDGRYVRYFLCGKDSVSENWKIYGILWDSI